MADTKKTGPEAVPPAEDTSQAAQLPLAKRTNMELTDMRQDLVHRVVKVEHLEEQKKDALAAMNRKLRKARKDMLAVARVLEEHEAAYPLKS